MLKQNEARGVLGKEKHDIDERRSFYESIPISYKSIDPNMCQHHG